MRKIVPAKVVGNTVVRLSFSDGSAGDYDLRDLIERDTVMTRPLSDPAFFHRCFLELGALCWPNGFELSASSLYRKLTEQGEISRAHRA